MAAVAIPAVVGGCSSDASNPLCCNEFKVGATIDAEIGGGAESKVAVQAVSDFAGIASAAVDDITTACRSMAQDLGADQAAQSDAESKGDKKEKLNAWCALAVASIKGAVSAGVKISVKFDPPKCEASFSAAANCQASCSASGGCDVKANPPKCTGGKLEVACKGECKAMGSATVACEGSCTGECKGSCEAQGGVECSGKCEGTCEAKGGAGGSGVDAQGNCQGTCKGTCSATPPGVTCSGSCKGQCTASCKGSAMASVKCDGQCMGDFEPLKCEGGKLEASCQVDAKCDANCNASVQAKAECHPPALTIDISGSANADIAAKLKATFEANLGAILAFKTKLEALVNIAADFSGNIKAVTDIKAACIPAVIAAGVAAIDNVQASAQASASVAGSITTN